MSPRTLPRTHSQLQLASSQHMRVLPKVLRLKSLVEKYGERTLVANIRYLTLCCHRLPLPFLVLPPPRFTALTSGCCPPCRRQLAAADQRPDFREGRAGETYSSHMRALTARGSSCMKSERLRGRQARQAGRQRHGRDRAVVVRDARGSSCTGRDMA